MLPNGDDREIEMYCLVVTLSDFNVFVIASIFSQLSGVVPL
jgi:hypothetical protein